MKRFFCSVCVIIYHYNIFCLSFGMEKMQPVILCTAKSDVIVKVHCHPAIIAFLADASSMAIVQKVEERLHDV